MSNYTPYSEYSASDVEWLGSIPCGWVVKRLKDVATYNDEALDENTDSDYELEYVDISSVNLVDGITTTEALTFSNAPSRARRKVRDGDTIVSTVRTYLKAIAAVRNPSENMIVSTGFAVIRPKAGGIDRDYLGYQLQSEGFVGDVVANSVGVSYPAINASELACLPVVEPPLAEQESIVRFLDYKTAQIDALIAKKQDLLKKLAEKRMGVIDKAVTSGLDEGVPTKPTGVDWLPNVPRHWKVMRLRFLLQKLEQGWSPQCHNQPSEPEEWGVLKVGCVNGELFDEAQNKALPDNLEPKTRYEIRSGEILMSRANTKELLGSAAIVPAGIREKLILCDKLYRLILTTDINGEYLIRLLRSSLARYQYEREATGTSGSMQNIGQDTIKNLVIPLPPLPEQIRISQHLSEALGKLQKIESIVTAAIAKLKEYRRALITSAVTGKIDLRRWVAKTKTAAALHA